MPIKKRFELWSRKRFTYDIVCKTILIGRTKALTDTKIYAHDLGETTHK